MPGTANCGRGLAVAVILQLVLVVQVRSYHHPLSETTYVHCWPLDANEDNDDTIDCNGLDMVWNEAPPLFIPQGDLVFLSVNVTADNTFYNSTNDFLQMGSSSGSGTDLEQFCQEECKMECNNVTSAEDCCVWHANVHICFPITEVCGEEPVCGPWILNRTFISYQTRVQCGALGTYSQEIQMNVPGVNTIIFHMQIGNLQIVLGSYTVVYSDSCGDGECQKTERCSSCPETMKNLEVCVVCRRDCCLLDLAIVFGATLSVLVAVVVVVITLSILMCVMCRRRRRMKDESWIISYKDIVISTGKKAASSLVSLGRKKDTGSVYSSMQDLQDKQIFTEIGTYKGRAVAIRRVHRRRSSFATISSKLRKEVLQIRSLDHQNLCKFIGATVEDPPPNVAIISEYCPKGSLNDVLQNDCVPLNWNFRFSFAGDIARGMAFLHSHNITHGRLTSSNCVIDDRWVTKVTDYGLPGLRHPEEGEGEGSEHKKGIIPRVYRAPETRDLPVGQPSNSPSADVYSYAIILFEIASRLDPHSEDELQLDAIYWKPRITLKQLNETKCPCSQEYLHLINKCWTFSPQTRHSFDKVKRVLHDINPSHNSAIDNMMMMMEKYSKHLEQLVRERTAELQAEKEKATILLYRMIPEAVAEDLKQGKTVGAETFSGATIFFSDIVGFTTLAGSSSPMEIVNLLNKLYTEFDEVLDQFDVYKVETIGDAYMVVSGVPRANGDSHAGEIAKMALQLMYCCKTFTIPHRPGTKLEIRAGIHSGSVCAGVVGVKMPRYCLFGDTVNTASRMESNSIAMHIQCSDATYQLLDKLGGFQLENRGVIEVKGKGPMNTWWLVDYTEPDIVALPPVWADTCTSNSPTTMEPIREPPKKYSLGVSSERSLDLRRSTTSLSNSIRATAADSQNSNGSGVESRGLVPPSHAGGGNGPGIAYKRNQSLQITGSFNSLLSVEAAEREGGEKSKPRRSTQPQESGELLIKTSSLASITRTTAPLAVRHSVPNVPQIKVFPTGDRRVTHPSVELVGLGTLAMKHSRVSQTSITSRDTPQLPVIPLHDKQDTAL